MNSGDAGGDADESAKVERLDAELQAELADLEARSLLRRRRRVDGAQGPRIELDGRGVLCLSSNNYLGLADDPRLIEAAGAALRTQGASGASSPLISGHMAAHAELEDLAAAWLGTEAAIIFGSGYHANIGTIGALTGPNDAIFSDALNHASLIDGARLSRATVRIYRHRDVEHLDELLRATPARRRLIVTDSIFSMDGDAAPLDEIVELAEHHGAHVMIDEAHAVGVFGDDGSGLANSLGLGARIAIRMGTLGKGLGSYGAFVAGSRSLIDVLVNRARAYVFSTALPPAVVAAATAAIGIARAERERRARLWANARALHGALIAAGLRVEPLGSPIVPLILGSAGRALAVSARMLEAGVFSPAIRPPTVPEGTARIRLTPLATHTPEEIAAAARVIIAAAREIAD